MSLMGQSFLSVDNVDNHEVGVLFSRARKLKRANQDKIDFEKVVKKGDRKNLLAALLFFEPSTRTRLSFQTACLRLGIRPFLLDSPSSSSLSKGERIIDTFENISMMDPDLIVLRHGEISSMEDSVNSSPVPVVNAGSGTNSHPTQALLDAFTIQERRGKITDEKILIVGDVAHSRVANSNLKLLKKLGAEVAICSPETMLPQDRVWDGTRKFIDLKEAISWATVCMGLRLQLERHKNDTLGLSLAAYRDKFRIDKKNLKGLVDDGLILHPGPFVSGVDFTAGVLEDPRCAVREQVRNGVYVRAALLTMILGWEV